MIQYEIERQRIQRNAQARQNTIANIGKIIEDGAQLVNTMGNLLSEQSAKDFMQDVFAPALEEAKRSGRFDHDDEGNALSAEASQGQYDSFVDEMLEQAPDNPWAKNMIRKSIDNQYDRNIASIFQSNLEYFNSTKKESMDSAASKFSTDNIDNPLAYNESTLDAYSYTYDELTDYEKELFDSGNVVSSRLLGISIDARKWGESPEKARLYAESYRDDLVISQFRSDAELSLTNDVINGTESYGDWLISLETDIAGIGTNPDYPSNITLTPGARNNLYNMIKESTDKLMKNEYKRQGDLLAENIEPVAQSYADRRVPFTSEVAANLESQIPGFNRKNLDPETRKIYEDHIRLGDSQEKVSSAINEANEIAAMNIPESAKWAEFERIAIMLGDDYMTQELFRMAKDSSPTFMRYSNISEQQIVDSYPLSPFIQPTFENDSFSVDWSTLDDPENDMDINMLLNDKPTEAKLVNACLASDPDVVASGAFDMTIAMRTFESLLTPEEIADYEDDLNTALASSMVTNINTLKGTDIVENPDEYESIGQPYVYLSPELNKRFYKFFEEYKKMGAEFGLKYGNNTNKYGEKFSELVESQRKEIIERKSSIVDGHAKADSSDIEGERLRRIAVSNILYEAWTLDPSERTLFIASHSDQMTSDEYKFSIALFSSDAGIDPIYDKIGIDIESMAKSKGLSITDPFVRNTLFGAVIDNIPLFMKAMNDPIYQQQAQDIATGFLNNELDYVKMNRAGILVEDNVISEYPSYDDLLNDMLASQKKARYTDPNSPSSYNVNRMAMDIIGSINSDPTAMTALFGNEYMETGADISDVSEENLTAYLLSCVLLDEPLQNVNEISDETIANLWNTFKDQSPEMQAITVGTVENVLAYAMTMGELKEYGLNPAGISASGNYIVERYDGKLMEIKPVFSQRGDMIQAKGKIIGTENNIDLSSDLFDMYIGSGPDRMLKKFKQELDASTDWDAIRKFYKERGEEYKVNNLIKAKMDEIFASDEWQEYNAEYKALFGYDLKPVIEEKGGILTGDYLKVRFADSGMLEINDESNQQIIADQNSFADYIRSSNASFGRMNSANTYIPTEEIEEYASDLLSGEGDNIPEDNPWADYRRKYEEEHPGKTIVPVISRGGNMNSFFVRFSERDIK